MLSWFRPKRKKVPYIHKIFAYVCAYAYDKGNCNDLDDFDVVELSLPPIRDIEFITKVNRQYISMALNQMVSDGLLDKIGINNRSTQFIICMNKDEIVQNLSDMKDDYPELFYNNSFLKTRAMNRTSMKDTDKLNAMYNMMPDFEKW